MFCQPHTEPCLGQAEARLLSQPWMGHPPALSAKGFPFDAIQLSSAPFAPERCTSYVRGVHALFSAKGTASNFYVCHANPNPSHAPNPNPNQKHRVQLLRMPRRARTSAEQTPDESATHTVAPCLGQVGNAGHLVINVLNPLLAALAHSQPPMPAWLYWVTMGGAAQKVVVVVAVVVTTVVVVVE